MTSPAQALTATTIEAWLTSRIVAYGAVSPEAVTPTADLTDLGLDSVYALSLCGDIEDEFDIDVDPTIAWDHPSIRELAAVLSEKIGA